MISTLNLFIFTLIQVAQEAPNPDQTVPNQPEGMDDYVFFIIIPMIVIVGYGFYRRAKRKNDQ
ncbi:MAG: hypothetical protein LAT68_02385 [Cyclobacteriaceae bacterium]|nr:hypothetical protein [Cyclobacteriaceae bacterium]MCH8515152.1 hypothetical protein [Cyclobacteriaceae bacterium]